MFYCHTIYYSFQRCESRFELLAIVQCWPRKNNLLTIKCVSLARLLVLKKLVVCFSVCHFSKLLVDALGKDITNVKESYLLVVYIDRALYCHLGMQWLFSPLADCHCDLHCFKSIKTYQQGLTPSFYTHAG